MLAQMLMANRAAAVVVRIELTRTTERRIRSFISLPAFYRKIIQHQYTITSPSETGYFFRVFPVLRKNLRFQTAHSEFTTIGSFFVFGGIFCDITGLPKRKRGGGAMRVGILSSLTTFTERFKTALENLHPERYQILFFSTIRQAETAANDHQIDVLLCDSRLYPTDGWDLSCPLILLVEKRNEEKTEGSLSYVCRYRNIRDWDGILQSSQNQNKICPAPEPETKKPIVLFTSAAGGTGTTTAAIAFSMYCAKKKWKPVYLNFEPICGSRPFFPGEGLYGLDECLSSIRSGHCDFHILMKQALLQDLSGVKYLEPCRVPQDMLSITGEEIVELCSCLRKESQVGSLILDVHLDASMNIVLPALTSQKIVLVTNGERIANEKTEEWLKILPAITNMSPIEVQEKTVLLYNRYRQSSGQVLTDVSLGKLGGINLRKEDEPELLAETLSKLEPFERLGEQLYV